MKPYYLTAAFAAAALLSACGQKAETDALAADQPVAANAASAEMDNMLMLAEKMAKGTGTVKAIDKAAGKITLNHGPIPEASLPAMTMAFSAKPAILEKVAVGDKVEFDITITGNAGEVTALTKQ